MLRFCFIYVVLLHPYRTYCLRHAGLSLVAELDSHLGYRQEKFAFLMKFIFNSYIKILYMLSRYIIYSIFYTCTLAYFIVDYIYIYIYIYGGNVCSKFNL
jgi:hypothetical protein